MTFIAAWLTGAAVILLVGGFVSGAWLGGLLWGIGAVVALFDWLRLRKSNEPAQVVADRMIAMTMFMLLGLVLPAAEAIHAWFGETPP
jgi:hypothetical protein